MRPPWNPAKLEQRIARAWRKKQRRTVTVVNLVAENTIEHGMLETLANKANLADAVLDGSVESLGKVKLKGGPRSHLTRLRQILAPEAAPPLRAPAPPADPAQDFARRASELLRGTLAHCEECLLPDGGGPVVLELAQARAITLREPLPDSSAECCAPRFAALWGRHAESIRLLVEDPPRVDLRELACAFGVFDRK